MKLNDYILKLDKGRALKKPIPYSYILGKENQKIFVFGAAHFRPPKDEQFKILKKLWNNFLNIRGKKIVFVENYLWPIGETFEESIGLGGEGGATVWLAKQAEIKVIVADLNFDELAKRLSVKFGVDKTAYHFIAYTMWNHARQNKDADLDKVIRGIRSIFAPLGLMPDRSWFDPVQEKFFPGQKPDLEFWNKSGSNALMGEMLTESTFIRNERAIELFEKYWSEGHSIFATYGANHTWEWEPALRKLTSS